MFLKVEVRSAKSAIRVVAGGVERGIEDEKDEISVISTAGAGDQGVIRGDWRCRDLDQLIGVGGGRSSEEVEGRWEEG